MPRGAAPGRGTGLIAAGEGKKAKTKTADSVEKNVKHRET